MSFEYADKLEIPELDRLYKRLAKQLQDESAALKAAANKKG